DFFLRDDETVDIVIADVSGHSVGAALIMSEVRTLLRAEVNSTQRPHRMLETLNTQLHDDLSRAELFITMFYAKYNSATGLLCYSNAGHNYPIILRSSSAMVQELDTDGLIFGVNQEVSFEELSVTLFRGDTLLLYTDGLTEACAHSGEMFGTSGLYSHLATVAHLPAREIIDSCYDKIRVHTGSEHLQDDISIVVVKIL
ncbi:MAG: PP2C family protein-serine/threonine phosphatase, partial [Desulfuromonadaceae bacterium]|nr:PP2C family protein-serine/threonine phosphatase [Desulfuromonadaceae bacterium]